MEEKADVVSFLSLAIWKEKVGRFRQQSAVDLSGEEFQLESLEGLKRFTEQDQVKVLEAKVNGNRLRSLEELNYFAGEVRKIFASENRLEKLCGERNEWKRPMTSLTVLNLSDNFLTEIPNLKMMPHLKELRLNKNRITSTSFTNLADGKSLEVLEMKDNKLSWESEKAFFIATEFFRDLTSLKRLAFAHNPFVTNVKDYALILVGQIRLLRSKRIKAHIDRVDEKRIDRSMKDQADAKVKKLLQEASKKMDEDEDPDLRALPSRPEEDMEEEEEALTVENGVAGNMSVFSTDTGGLALSGIVPTISELNAKLEECFTHPTRCIGTLAEITRQVNGLVDRPGDHRFLFQARKNAAFQESSAEAIELFLLNLSLLAERQPQITQTLLRILVYLSVVSDENLGDSCVKQLQSLMGGGETLANEVIDVINDHMVPLLDRTSDKKLHGVITQNLVALASSSSIPDGLQKSPLDSALPFIVKSLLLDRGSPLLDSVIEMAAVASAKEPLAKKLGSHRLAPKISHELLYAQVGSARYLALVNIVRNLSEYDIVRLGNDADNGASSRTLKDQAEAQLEDKELENEEFHLLVQQNPDGNGRLFDYRSARAFAKVGIHREVLKNLRSLVEEMERSSSDAGNDLIRRSILCLSAMSHAKAVFQDLMDTRVGYFGLLFQLYNHVNVGPVILSAVFTALCNILTVPSHWYPLRYEEAVFERQMVFAEVTRRLQRIVPLLQYLGEKGSKFVQMCNLVPRAEKHVYFSAERKCLANLRSPTMHALLVSVIDLITIYNKEASSSTNHLAVRITQELNQNKREAFLFACLNTPSDDVRLAVVRCLQEIQLSEFDHQEINYLVELLANATNISAGKTEEVLGGSFLLLTKLCLSSHASGASFRVNFAEKSAVAALNILERNEQRDTRGQIVESYQKRILSTACVQYLQACSQFRTLRNFLRSHEVLERVISILYIEDTHTANVRLHPRDEAEISREMYRPNLVERTLCGRQVEYLLRTLVGFRSIDPARVVAPRILRRIADVLMGIPDPSLSMVRRFWSSEDSSAPHEPESAAQTPGGPNQPPESPLNGTDGVPPGGGELTPSSSSHAVKDVSTDSVVPDEQSASSSESARKLPSWVLSQMHDCSDPSLDFRVLTNKLAQKEKLMPAYWNSIMGPQVGCSDIWIETNFLGQEDLVEKVQQHQLLIHFSGLERLLLFLVGAVEKFSGDSESGLGSALEENVSHATGTDNIPSTSAVAKLLQQFDSIDANQMLQDIFIRSEAANKVIRESKQQNGTQDTLKAQVTGRELLLRYFMQETLDELGTPVRQKSNSATDQALEGSDFSYESYPDADSVMFANNAAQAFRRDTEVTDTLIAGLRVIYSLVRFGNSETTEAARAALRAPSKLRLLACLCSGPPSNPIWPRSLIGAKFMAIAYELCLMPGVRREEGREILSVYSIVCHVAKRIMSTLRFFAEARTLTETDLVTAMHTTRTLALIASQLRFVRLNDALGTISKETRKLGLEAVWRLLIPFESTVKGCISVLIACSQSRRVVRHGTGIEVVENCIREHISQFLVSAFSLSKNSRFEVLEELVRTQINEKGSLRSTYIQELLNRVAYTAFGDRLRLFMLSAGHFALGSQCEDEEEAKHPVDTGGGETLVGEELPSDTFGSAKMKKDQAIQKKKSAQSSSSFFSFCAGPRTKDKDVKKDMQLFQPAPATPAAKPSAPMRKVWLVEPPATLPRKALNSGAKKMDRQGWEYDRIGTERILFSTFADVHEFGTMAKRRLLVLTSEAYYMYGEPEEGRGWQVLFSADSRRSTDDLFTNPLLFATPSIFEREDFQPVLLWRKPYRAISRLVLGLYGERVHILHRNSDLVVDKTPIPLTVLTYVNGVANRLYALLMQMCREWAQIEMSLGVDASHINVPEVEYDEPMHDAIESLLDKLNVGEAGGEALLQRVFSRVSGKPATPGLAARKGSKLDAAVHMQGFRAGKWLEFSFSTGLSNEFPDVLLSQVQLVLKDGSLLPRVVVLTPKTFTIVEAHWELWGFPTDFKAERDKLMKSVEDRLANSKTPDGSFAASEGTRAKMIATKNAELESKIEREMNIRKSILVDAHSQNTHSMLDLNEVLVDKGENPMLTVGFGKEQGKGILRRGGASSNSNNTKGKTGNVPSEHYYDIIFYDHHTREVWCQKLLSSLGLR